MSASPSTNILKLQKKTIKFLVAITSSGVISFLSKVWGGVYNKELTQGSGFLYMLVPTDEIMADQGFLIQEDLASSLRSQVNNTHFYNG